jgi:hypothetical protein
MGKPGTTCGILIDPVIRRIDEITLDNSSDGALLNELCRHIGCRVEWLVAISD